MRSIRNTFSLGLSAIILAIGISAGISYFYITTSHSEKNLERQIQKDVKILSSDLTIPLWTFDTMAINYICGERLKDRIISAIKVIDSGSNIIFDKGKTDDPYKHVIRQDILYKTRLLGHVEVFYFTGKDIGLWKNVMGALIVVLTAVVLAAMITTQVLLKRYLVRPLLTLREGVRRLDHGHFDQLLPANEKEEISQITLAVNSLAGKLSEREKEVREHTAAIERSNYELSNEVTERKKAEEAIRKEKDKLKKYLDISAVMVIMVDRDQKVTLINRKGCEILGYSDKEILGKNWLDNFLPDRYRDEVKVVFSKLMAGEIEPIEYFENPVLTKSGEERMIAWYNTVFRDDEGNAIATLGSGGDITDRNKAEIERELLLAELERKNRELEQVLYVTTHDLRTPLVNIDGFNGELELSVNELISEIRSVNIPDEVREKTSRIVNEDISEALRFISLSITKMDSLLSGLLKLSRVGRAELKIEQLDMNKMLKDISSVCKSQLNQAGVELEISELPSCKGEEIKINQVFSNLIENAISFLNPNQDGIIRVSGRTENGHSVFCVEDNGIGISPEHHEKIFEIFYQLKPKKSAGEGLGLTIVKKLVDIHKGKIWVESEPGTGSKFYVSIPN